MPNIQIARNHTLEATEEHSHEAEYISNVVYSPREPFCFLLTGTGRTGSNECSNSLLPGTDPW